MWINRTVTLQMRAVIDRLNIRRINPYKFPEVDWIRSSKYIFNIHILSTYINVTNKYFPTFKYTQVYIRFKTENSFHENVITLSQRNKSLSYSLVHKYKVL